VTAPTDNSDGSALLARLAEAAKLEQQQAWAELAQPVALVDAFAFLMRWGDPYSRLPLLLALADRMERREPCPPPGPGPAPAGRRGRPCPPGGTLQQHPHPGPADAHPCR
jgi:hypothetical protein